MSSEFKKNYYELLNITPDASSMEIEEAYRQAKSLYTENSVAAYSLYSKSEKEALFKDITMAFETLKDPVRKNRYDTTLETHEHGAETREVDLLEMERDTITRKPELEKITNVVRLKQPLMAMNEAEPMVAEQYRTLATKLDQISDKKGYKVFAVTSALKDEGKSMTSLNLAYLMASEFKKRTILVEFDMRKPSSVMDYLDKSRAVGIGDVLSGEQKLHSSIIKIKGVSLYVIPSGNTAQKASALMDHLNIRNVLDTLKAGFDYIIVDSPPLLPLVDMNIISRFVDGLIIVVRAGKTPKDAVIKAVKSVSGVTIIGMVLNGAEIKFSNYYY